MRRFERQIGSFIHVIVTPTRVEIQDIHGGCVVVDHITGKEIADGIIDGIEEIDNPPEPLSLSCFGSVDNGDG